MYTENNMNKKQLVLERLKIDLTNKSLNELREFASAGKFHESLVTHSDPVIRATIARHGNCLNILVHDRDIGVRVEVARQGYGLGILSKDTHWAVRAEVARHCPNN